MDGEIGLLSDEMLDLSLSFESTAEFDLSFQRKSHISDNIFQNGDRLLNSIDNSLSIQKNGTANTTNYQSQNDSHNSTGMSEGLSLYYKQSPSTGKIKELKQVMLEANEAYNLWMSSQLILDSVKMCEKQVEGELSDRVKQIRASANLKQLTQLRSRSGEVLNILGLEEADVEAEANESLSIAESGELRDRVVTILRATVHRLSTQRKELKGVLGVHCQKVTPADSVLCEERERLAVLHHQVRQQLEQAGQLLVDSNRTMQQLAQLVQCATQDLRVASYVSLKDKAKFLHNNTSMLKHKMDQEAYMNQNHTKAINTLGDNLKTALNSASEQLKSLQKALGEYQKKEETSKRYREIVSEFARTKRHLHHKYQTLKVLNDPDVSFS